MTGPGKGQPDAEEDDGADSEFNESGEGAQGEGDEELTVMEEEPIDEWKLVEMARIVVATDGGSADYDVFDMTPDQFKKFEMVFVFWTSQPLDKQVYSLPNLIALVQRKGGEVAGNEPQVAAIHQEAQDFYDNAPDFDSEEEFKANVHQKEKVNEKVETTKKRGKDALLGAFGARGP